MGRYNWIKGEDFTIDYFMLMDRWMHQKNILPYAEIDIKDFTNHDKTFGTLLKRNEALQFVILNRAPEVKKGLERLIEGAYENISDEDLRKNEIKFMEDYETDLVYVAPRVMEENCNYITEWDEKYLYELGDLKDKVVLDLGAGTGRLTFAAAKVAKMVYASEPVDMLREYLRDKIKKDNIKNVKVLDGMVMDIPYEDNTFDVVTSGHVVGDYYDEEIAEMSRVLKPGGWIIICNGDDDITRKAPNKELVNRGFNVFYHKSKVNGDIYNYTKQIIKK